MSSMTTLVNIHKTNEYDVYIGRAGKGFNGEFGNPPEHLHGGVSRDTAVERFRTYFYKRIESDENFRSRVSALKGQRLGCFCYPLKCHGMVYIEYLEGISVDDQVKAAKPQPKPVKPLKAATEPVIDIFAD